MGSVSSVNPGIADLLQTLTNVNSPVMSSKAAVSALEKAPAADIVQLSAAANQLESVDAMFGISTSPTTDVSSTLTALESLGQALVDGSLCGLGRAGPNPVLTSIRYFKDEYLAHIVDHKCSAGVCRDLITYRIDPGVCNGCGLCAADCPGACISGKKKKAHVIDAAACIRCGACQAVCPVDAVRVA